jgi:hypothetical protein
MIVVDVELVKEMNKEKLDTTMLGPEPTINNMKIYLDKINELVKEVNHLKAQNEALFELVLKDRKMCRPKIGINQKNN